MLNIEDNHTCVQYMEAQEARTSLRAHRDDERRVAAHERRWHAQERARQQREQREQREQQRPKPPSMEELQRRGEEAGVAAMARAAMVAVADVQRLQKREQPTTCTPADPAHWSLGLAMPLVLQLLVESVEVHRDELLLLCRSVCWATWHYVMHQQEQPEMLGPKYLHSHPVELMRQAALPCCVRNMLACDGLAPPTFHHHSLGMQLGGATADAIARRVQLHVQVSDVLRRLQSGAPIEGTTTELHLRIR